MLRSIAAIAAAFLAGAIFAAAHDATGQSAVAEPQCSAYSPDAQVVCTRLADAVTELRGIRTEMGNITAQLQRLNQNASDVLNR